MDQVNFMEGSLARLEENVTFEEPTMTLHRKYLQKLGFIIFYLFNLILNFVYFLLIFKFVLILNFFFRHINQLLYYPFF